MTVMGPIILVSRLFANVSEDRASSYRQMQDGFHVLGCLDVRGHRGPITYPFRKPPSDTITVHQKYLGGLVGLNLMSNLIVPRKVFGGSMCVSATLTVEIGLEGR